MVEIVDYFDRNRDVLESYVLESIPLNQLEKWISKKKSRNLISSPSNSKMLFRRYNKEKLPKKQMLMDLVKSLQADTDEHSVLWKLVSCVTTTIGVDAFRVYKLSPDHSKDVEYFSTDTVEEILNPTRLKRADPLQVVMVQEAAKKAVPWSIYRANHLVTFPDTPHHLFKLFGAETETDANYILYQPIMTAKAQTAYVLEMWRIDSPFSEKEEVMSSNFLVWGSLALHYCSLYLDKKRHQGMPDFLLDVVKAIFEEMVSLEQLIKRILEFAQRLVNAERASLFLVDHRRFELVSTVFDLKYEPGVDRDLDKKEIRMLINRGIAGHVAISGETLNIPDAYSDLRFNREVDEVSGYKTRSILCMPIKIQGEVIGVVQMVNKKNQDYFNHDDEVAFEIFSTFFGLALHHAMLYDRIIRKEQKYRVALEVLSYHNTCRENEVQAVLVDRRQLDANINDYFLDPYRFTDFEKCKAAITMFDDLFDIRKFDLHTVARFILTVKKNYRRVPYHNFDHGWCVAHAMYVILKNDHMRRFDYNMRLAMFVASLCHDLDHRGYTNKYMSETASPLAAMYTTSTLEHHHFNITVTILQQEGHNIFSNFSSADYKEILECIRQCILATDLAVFLPNLHRLNHVLDGVPKLQSFDWNISSHRELAIALTMTAADLAASVKPWEIQLKTVKVIFEEFYEQGDKEKAAGRTPIAMMDRNRPDEQPSSQVGFLGQICVPCYRALYRLLPNTKPMYIMALRNLSKWKIKAGRVIRKLAKEVEYDNLGFEDEENEDNEKANTTSSVRQAEDAERTDIKAQEAKKLFAAKERQEDGVTNSIATAWKSINLNPTLWEEPEKEAAGEDANFSGIWKHIDIPRAVAPGVIFSPSRVIRRIAKNENEAIK